MTRTRRQALGGPDAAALLASAADGDEHAFDGLFRRYAPEAWRYASGVAGDEPTARHAVTDGFATSVAAARDGAITHPGGFRRSLLAATRLRVAERDDPAVAGHAGSSEPIAPAFAALPELLRSVLWFEHVHRLRPNRIAEVTATPSAEVVDLARRAHHGLATHHLDAQARAANDECSQALRGSARSLARRLPVRDRVAVRAHVASCASCSATVALANNLDTALPPLAAAFPEDLAEETRAAWIVAITPPSPTGLSPVVEKALAAASATAAVVAIVGAAYWRGTPADTSVAISPVLHQVGSPIPDLGSLDLDSAPDLPDDTAPDGDSTGSDSGTNSGGSSGPAQSSGATGGGAAAPVAGGDAQGLSGSDATVSRGVGNSTGGSTGDDAPTDTTDDAPPSDSSGSEPLLEISLPLGGQSLDIGVGGEDGVSVESTDGSDADLVETDGALDALDPVTKAVSEAVKNLVG